MGEAKQKLEQKRAEFLKVIEGWIKPPTEEEAQIAKALSNLNVVVVPRAPAEQIAYMRMKPRECHLNCQFYAKNDPEKKSKMVFGWTIDSGVFVLHSVIKREGSMFCITPTELSDTKIKFIPDNELAAEITAEGKYEFYRSGIKIEGYGIRPDPEETIAFGNVMKRRLQSGMNPYEAMKPPYE